MRRIDRGRRQQLSRMANEIRLRGLRDRLPASAIAEAICAEMPELFALEAWRLAHAWSRIEVSARLDALYQADGLAGPKITSAELCRWEHEQRRPTGADAVELNDRRLHITKRLVPQIQRLRTHGASTIDLAWTAHGET